MTTAYRWFTVGRDGALTGYGSETGRPPWRAGLNTAVCGIDSDHEPPAPWCGCGFTCSTSLAAVAAHATHTAEALQLSMRLHHEAGGHKVKSFVTGIDSYALVQVDTSGRLLPASTEDEQEWFHRVQHATIVEVHLPAAQRRNRVDVARRYDVDVIVAEQSGRAWLDTFADGIAPTPEQLGCGFCPRPNPGVDEYPLCVMCANRARKGIAFGRPDGSPYNRTLLGYK